MAIGNAITVNAAEFNAANIKGYAQQTGQSWLFQQRAMQERKAWMHRQQLNNLGQQYVTQLMANIAEQKRAFRQNLIAEHQRANAERQRANAERQRVIAERQRAIEHQRQIELLHASAARYAAQMAIADAIRAIAEAQIAAVRRAAWEARK